jgi:hypothetical protein
MMGLVADHLRSLAGMDPAADLGTNAKLGAAVNPPIAVFAASSACNIASPDEKVQSPHP